MKPYTKHYVGDWSHEVPWRRRGPNAKLELKNAKRAGKKSLRQHINLLIRDLWE